MNHLITIGIPAITIASITVFAAPVALAVGLGGLAYGVFSK
jgi:hypothetical protein